MAVRRCARFITPTWLARDAANVYCAAMTRIVAILLCCLGVLPIVAMPALAAGPASENLGGSVELVAGDPVSKDVWRAGLSFRLESGWKTYWRVPGDSGVPPVFDWAGSTNLADVAVHWPAPAIIDDAGGQSIGYTGDVVLPLHVRPLDPTKPVELLLSLNYAVCSTMCVPAHAQLSLRLDGSRPDDASAALVGAHEKRVPVSVPLGAAADTALTEIALDRHATPPRLRITGHGARETEVFVEGPADWFFAPVRPTADASGRFTADVALDGIPKDAQMAGTRLTITVSSGMTGIEVPFTLP